MKEVEGTIDYTLVVKKIPILNLITIEKQSKYDQFFVTGEKSIAISVQALSTLLAFLVHNGYFSHKILEGILEEYYSNNEY